jgi:peptidoglycan/LPS O-acetylase OafA/YrhL
VVTRQRTGVRDDLHAGESALRGEAFARADDGEGRRRVDGICVAPQDILSWPVLTPFNLCHNLRGTGASDGQARMLQPQTDISRKYFLSIDGLRLFASLNIVLLHFAHIGALQEVVNRPWILSYIIKGPAFHASAFFIIGGFIFTIKFADRVDTFSWTTFFRKRFLDLYPLHFGMTLAMAALIAVRASAASGLDMPNLLYSCFVHLGLLWAVAPFGALELNQPSWALSAFFFCYLCFGPLLKAVAKLRRRRTILVAMVACCIPPLLWSFAYVWTGNGDLYLFFHIFAPIRVCEFALGMLLARFYAAGGSAPRTRWWQSGAVNDLFIIAAVVLVLLNVRWGAANENQDALLRWLSYHIAVLPLYGFLTYRLACGNGLICRVLGNGVVREIGRSSFYPYLIHIPLISWLTWTMEVIYHNDAFLRSDRNVLIFLVVLYAGSTLYSAKVKRVTRVKYAKLSE